MLGRKRRTIQKLEREKAQLESELQEAHFTIRKLEDSQRPANKGRPRYNYIVRDDYRFVYLWVHKVACSSVKAALLPLFDLDSTPHEQTLPDGRRHFIVHDVFESTAYQVSQQHFLNSKKYEHYFKFAFTRNPFDRLLSCYRDKIERPNIPRYMLMSAKRSGTLFYPRMPFAEFVETVCNIPDHLADGHFRPQHLTIRDQEGKIAADYVGKFENLTEDFSYIKQKIGASDLELPERNRINSARQVSTSYQDFYDERLKDLMYERYEKDFENFGYTF